MFPIQLPSCVRVTAMNAFAWLRRCWRPTSPPESSPFAGLRPASGPPASSCGPDATLPVPAVAAYGLRAFLASVLPGPSTAGSVLRRVAAALLLALPLPGVSAPAALAQQPTFSASTGSPVSEGDGSFPCSVERTAGTVSSSLTVNLDIDQTGDFLASGAAGNQSFTRGTGTSETYTVSLDDDTLDEPDGTVTCTVLDGTGYTVHGTSASATIAITDDDPTVVSFSGRGGHAIYEGNRNAQFTVTLGRALVAGEIVDVPLAVGGTASAADWSLALGWSRGATLSGGTTATPKLRFSGAGARTAHLVLKAVADSVNDHGETVTVALGPDGAGANGFDRTGLGTNVGGGADPHGTSNSRTYTIMDPDVSLRARTRVRSYSADEGDAALLMLELYPRQYTATAVSITCTDGTATGGTGSGFDYDCPDTVTIPAGTRWHYFSIPTVPDAAAEGDETFTVRISSLPTGIRKIGWSHVYVTIVDDKPTVTVTRDGFAVTEGSDAAFTVHANPAPASDLTVNLSVSETDSAFYGDFVAPGDEGAQTVTVPAGKTSVPWTVPTDGDTTDETDGEVTLRVQAGTGTPKPYAVGGPSSATVNVRDDDGGALLAPGAPPRFATVEFKGANRFSVIELPVPPGVGGLPSPQSDVRLSLSIAAHFPATVGGWSCRLGPHGYKDIHIVDTTYDGAIVHKRTLPASGTVGVPVRLCAGAVGKSFHVIWMTVKDPNSPPDNPETYPRFDKSAPNCQMTKTYCRTEVKVVGSEQVVPPTASFASASQTVQEGSGTSDVTVNLSPAPAADITLAYTVDGTATSGSDYTALSGTLSVPKDATTATIPVAIVDDSLKEESETIILTLSAGSGYEVGSPGSHTLTIAASNPPVASFASASQTVQEGSGTSDVTVNLSPAPAADITLAYTVGGTATSGSDYTALSGTLPVPKDATTATIPVAIVDDGANEDAETVVLTLSAGSDYDVGSPGSHTLTIAASDPPAVSFASASQSAQEGSGTSSVTVTLSPAPAADITLSYTVDGTATSGSDYTALSGTVAVSAGATTATIPVAIVDDGANEDAETVVLTLATGSGYEVGSPGTHTLTIAASDPPAASFALASQTAQEGSGTSNVTVNLSPAPASDITLSYTVDGTATSGSDYTALSGTVTVPKDATTATIPVAIVDDGANEGAETVVLTLATGSGYEVGSPGSHTLTIAASDPPTASFASASQSAQEGSGTSDVTVNLSPAPAADITLSYTVDGTATSGSDYTALSGTVAVSAGATTATIPVAIIDDSLREDSETVVLTLSAGSGYEVGSPGTHTLTIAASDGPPQVSFEPIEGSTDANTPTRWVKEGSGTHNVKVRLNPPPTSDITINYKVSGNAIPGSDHTALSGTLSVPKGATTATIPVTIIDDDEREFAEEIVLLLLGGTGYEVGSPDTHTLIIDPSDGLPWISLVPVQQSAGEGSGTHDVGVRLGPAPATDIAFAYRVAGTATSGSDYKALSGSVTVSRGATTAKIPVTLIDDSLKEGSETIILDLTGSGGYKVTSPGTHTLTIVDDETPASLEPQVTIAAGSSPVTEGSDATFMVTANPAPASPLAVTVTVATAGDYGVIAGDRTVTIPVTGSETLTMTTTGDDADEPDGSVTATVKDGEGYTVGSSASGTVAIADDDPAPPAVATADPALVAQVRGYAAETDQGQAHVDRWKRVLAAFGDDNGYTAMTAAEAQIHADKGWQRWVQVVAALEALEAVPEPPTLPAVSVSAGADVTEGGDAVFTVTANPAPASPLSVTVTVATAGEFGVTAGSRTVPIPTTGSATLTLATTGDDADEPDGSVSVTVAAGEGYTVGDPASGTVAIADDDPAPAAVATVDPALVAQVRGYAAETWKHPDHVKRWKRVLAAFGDDNGYTAMTAAEAQTYADRGWQRWVPVAAALAALEAVPEPPTLPAVSVSAGADVTEGGDAAFTVTASPASPLSVTVTVATAGEFGVTAGTQTVPIPTTGSATLTLATANDDADEPDGSVSVTVAAGEGYTVGDPASGTVAVQDDDAPLPAITISAGASPVTEGGNAAFTVTASPAPAAELSVTVTVATAGEFGVTAGTQTVPIPTTGSATLTLATTGDEVDEADGSVSVTVAAGEGYTVGDPASGTVAVRDDDEPLPEITVSAGDAVIEGGDAVFTVSASPAPASSLAVTVAVAVEGDFGIASGTQTVSIPTAGSATLTLATTGDDADEPDGSVTATVTAGEGYTVGAPATGSVSIADDDLPPPVVSIAAKAVSVTEGGAAAFTLTADRAPDADLTVTLSVAETGGGDHVAAADEGPATAVIAKGATEAAFSVATMDDDANEPDGSVTVTLKDGGSYTVPSPPGNAAAVTVSDNDAAVGPVLSVDDTTGKENGRLPAMPFTVRLSAPARDAVRVYVSTRPSTPVSATPRVDYTPASYALLFRAGETEKQVWVMIHNDSHDEEPETFEVVLSKAQGAPVGDGVAVGTITNDDPMPAAWLARFGRAVAEQALDGIAARMTADRTPGLRGTIAGQALDFGGNAAGGPDLSQFPGSLSPGSLSGAGPGLLFGPGVEAQSRGMTMQEVLRGSSFSLTGEADGSGGTLSFWGGSAGSGGLVSGSQFAGSQRGDGTAVRLDGETGAALLGTDYARGRWLVGFALSQVRAEGGYASEGGSDCSGLPESVPASACAVAAQAGDGEVEASLTATIPYVALAVSERLRLWGAAGQGAGDVTVKTGPGGSYRADTAWSMAAAGLRGDLLASPAPGSGSGAGSGPGSGTGPALALTSDALWVRTSSEKTGDLAASESDVSRLRVGLEGSWGVALSGGGSVTPKLELGARHDGGDAETGFGVELGGGLAWRDPKLGLTLDLSGRTLVAHDDGGLEDRGVSARLSYDPEPSSGRGLSLSLGQDWGVRSAGGLDALFRPEPLEDRAGSGGGHEATSRWAMEAAWGLPVLGGRFTGSPYMGLGLATGARDYSLGWRFRPEAANALGLSFGLRATKRESDAQAPEHTVGGEIAVRW